MNRKAVITGDIIHSRKIEDKATLLRVLNRLFRELSGQYTFTRGFEVFRGDSFQAVVEKPHQALRIAILIRLGLYSYAPKTQVWDARIGIGIGTIQFLEENVTSANGEAFENSGQSIDQIKGSDRRIHIKTTDTSLNRQLNVLNILNDGLSSNWTKKSAEVMYRYLLFGETQQEIAETLRISQSAVQQRLKTGKTEVLIAYIRYFEKELNV